MAQDDLERSSERRDEGLTLDKAILGITSINGLVALVGAYVALGFCICAHLWQVVLVWIMMGLLMALRYNRSYGLVWAFMLWPLVFVVRDDIRLVDNDPE